MLVICMLLNRYDFLSSVKHKKNRFWRMSWPSSFGAHCLPLYWKQENTQKYPKISSFMFHRRKKLIQFKKDKRVSVGTHMDIFSFLMSILQPRRIITALSNQCEDAWLCVFNWHQILIYSETVFLWQHENLLYTSIFTSPSPWCVTCWCTAQIRA